MHRDRRATTPWPSLRLAPAGSPGEGHRLRRGVGAGKPARPAHHSLPVPFSGRSWPLPVMSPDPGPGLMRLALFLAALLAAAPAAGAAAPPKPWWQGAVIYEIYPRSFQ